MNSISKQYFLVGADPSTPIETSDQKPDGGAKKFFGDLETLFQSVGSNSTKLPDVSVFENAMTTVINGYEAKLGILQLIWDCVLRCLGISTTLDELELTKGRILGQISLVPPSSSLQRKPVAEVDEQIESECSLRSCLSAEITFFNSLPRTKAISFFKSLRFPLDDSFSSLEEVEGTVILLGECLEELQSSLLLEETDATDLQLDLSIFRSLLDQNDLCFLELSEIAYQENNINRALKMLSHTTSRCEKTGSPIIEHVLRQTPISDETMNLLIDVAKKERVTNRDNLMGTLLQIVFEQKQYELALKIGSLMFFSGETVVIRVFEASMEEKKFEVAYSSIQKLYSLIRDPYARRLSEAYLGIGDIEKAVECANLLTYRPNFLIERIISAYIVKKNNRAATTLLKSLTDKKAQAYLDLSYQIIENCLAEQDFNQVYIVILHMGNELNGQQRFFELAKPVFNHFFSSNVLDKATVVLKFMSRLFQNQNDEISQIASQLYSKLEKESNFFLMLELIDFLPKEKRRQAFDTLPETIEGSDSQMYLAMYQLCSNSLIIDSL